MNFGLCHIYLLFVVIIPQLKTWGVTFPTQTK